MITTDKSHIITSGVLACALAMVLTTSARGDLVSYWNFNNDVLDGAPGGVNNGALFGPTFSVDVPAAVGSGASLSLSGPGSYVGIPANANLNSPTFTLSYWLKDPGQLDGAGVSTSAGHNRITSRGSDSFETGVSNAATATLPDSSRLKFFASGWETTPATTNPSAWTHVAYVADGSMMSVYANGTEVFSGPRTIAPAGAMYVGARVNAVTPNEGFTGLIDDMALWNNAFPASSIAMLASGAATPLSLSIPEPPPPPNVIVVSNTTDWTLSTESIDGGAAGTWVSTGAAPPAASTFTLTPTATAAGAIPHINNAAAAIGATGLIGDPNVHYYRTTFNLDASASISANILFAADNGGEIWINGEKLATETSFLVDNWSSPLPSISIAADGGVTTTKFDSSAAAFESWLVGENELIVALRNPNSEVPPAGGFALRMEISATPIPEPSAILIVGTAAALLGGAALRRRRR